MDARRINAALPLLQNRYKEYSASRLYLQQVILFRNTALSKKDLPEFHRPGALAVFPCGLGGCFGQGTAIPGRAGGPERAYSLYRAVRMDGQAILTQELSGQRTGRPLAAPRLPPPQRRRTGPGPFPPANRTPPPQKPACRIWASRTRPSGAKACFPLCGQPPGRAG